MPVCAVCPPDLCLLDLCPPPNQLEQELSTGLLVGTGCGDSSQSPMSIGFGTSLFFSEFSIICFLSFGRQGGLMYPRLALNWLYIRE